MDGIRGTGGQRQVIEIKPEDAIIVKGEVNRPQLMVMLSRKTAKFDPIEVTPSFIPAIFESVDDIRARTK